VDLCNITFHHVIGNTQGIRSEMLVSHIGDAEDSVLL
jgi:hypothetical protein